MKSVKMSERANRRVVILSEKFHMSKQSFVSLVLENIGIYEVQMLLARELQDGLDSENVGYMQEAKLETLPDEPQNLTEITDGSLPPEFDDDFMVGDDKIKGL